MGYTPESIIVMENGNRLVLEKDSAYFGEPAPCGRVLVDSSGYAGVSDEVLRDRRNLASDGVVFINVAVDSDAGRIAGDPEIIARGVMAPNNELEELKSVLVEMLSKLGFAEIKDTGGVHQMVSDVARKFLKRTTNKRPLVVASIVDV